MKINVGGQVLELDDDLTPDQVDAAAQDFLVSQGPAANEMALGDQPFQLPEQGAPAAPQGAPQGAAPPPGAMPPPQQQTPPPQSAGPTPEFAFGTDNLDPLTAGALGAGDALLNVGSQMAGTAVGGLEALAGVAGGDRTGAGQTVQERTQAMTWEPKTKEGAAILDTINRVMAPVGEAIEKATDWAGNLAYEGAGGGTPGAVAGAFTETIPTIIELLIAKRSVRGADGTPKLDTETQELMQKAVEAETPEQALVALEQAIMAEPQGAPGPSPGDFGQQPPPAPGRGGTIDLGSGGPTLESRAPVPGGPVPPKDVKADLSAGVPNNATATKKIENPQDPYEQQRVVDDPAGIAAVKQQVQPGAVASIKAANAPTRQKMSEALDELEKGMENDTYAADHRPADVAGRMVEDMYKQVKAKNKEAAAELDKVAKDLNGVTVDVVPAMERFLDELAQLGARPHPRTGKLIWSERSEIAGMKKVQKRLGDVWAELLKRKNPDGWDVHTFKKWIDNTTSYGKGKDKGLLGSTERIIKGLRHDLNQELQSVSPEYARVNTQYAETRTAMDELQVAMGRTRDLDSGKWVGEQLGTLLRRTLSNAASRMNVNQAVDNIARTADKYDAPGPGEPLRLGDKPNSADLKALLMFINTLEEQFGSSAPTSFMHEITKAGMAGARSKMGSPEGVFDLGKIMYDKVMAPTDAKRMAALRALLEEPKPKSK